MKKSYISTMCIFLLTCICIVMGTTYAYFSNQSDFEIDTKLEDVDLDVELSGLKTYENGVEVADPNTFTDGSVAINKDEITLNNLSGYVKVEFEIFVKNNSNKDVKFRFSPDIIHGLQRGIFTSLLIDGNEYFPYDSKIYDDDFFVDDMESYNETFDYIPVTTIKAGEKLGAFNAVINNTPGLYDEDNSLCPSYTIKLDTYEYDINEDITIEKYDVKHILDNYYGIYKFDDFNRVTKSLSIADDIPLLVRFYSEVKFTKIYEDKEAYIIIEKGKIDKEDEINTNVLDFSLKFVNIDIDNIATTQNMMSIDLFDARKDNFARYVKTNNFQLEITSNYLHCNENINYETQKYLNTVALLNGRYYKTFYQDMGDTIYFFDNPLQGDYDSYGIEFFNYRLQIK